MSDFGDRQQGLIRALLYVVMFQQHPAEAIAHAINKVVRVHALGATEEEYLHAIRSALASSLHLSELLPQPHSEMVVRNFLAHLASELQSQVETQVTALRKRRF
jgi:hypothetical protein